MPGRLPSSQELLNDTLILVRLARETAIAHGKSKQVERFSPIIENLKKVVETAQEPTGQVSMPQTFAEKDLQKLLSTIQSTSKKTMNNGSSSSERNQIIVAMAAGGMQEIDIARQMGMTRDEVRTILQLDSKKNNLSGRTLS